jgi:Bifunctional DNA primase/polymerase, N-terminal
LGWLAEHPFQTRRHKTPRGWHLLFRHGEGVKCSAGRIGKGIDIRGSGGFIVWWPREGYEVGGEIGDWPEEILGLLNRRFPNREDGKPPAHDDDDADVKDAVDWLEPTVSVKMWSKYVLQKVERAEEGNRHNCLFWATCRFEEMIGEGKIKREIAEQLLWEAAKVNGVVGEEPDVCRAAIRDGLNTGIQVWDAYVEHRKSHGGAGLTVLPIKATTNP